MAVYIRGIWGRAVLTTKLDVHNWQQNGQGKAPLPDGISVLHVVSSSRSLKQMFALLMSLASLS